LLVWAAAAAIAWEIFQFRIDVSTFTFLLRELGSEVLKNFHVAVFGPV